METNHQALRNILAAIKNLPKPSTIDDASASANTVWSSQKVIDYLSRNYAASNHNHVASAINGGTFAGAVIAQTSTQTPSTSLLRNSKLVTTETNPSYNGEICWTYE